MPLPTLKAYLISIDVLQSEEQLLSIEASVLPHMTKVEERKEILQKHKRTRKTLVDWTQGKLSTIQDVAKALAGMMKSG